MREKAVLENSKKKIKAKNTTAEEQILSLCEKISEVEESLCCFQGKRNAAIDKLVQDNELKLNSMYQESGLSLPVTLERRL